MTDDRPRFSETTRRFGVLTLDVRVHGSRLGVRLLPLQRGFRWIPRHQVSGARVTTYAPSTYGGWHWGMRTSPGGNTAYRLHGDHGVELTLVDGRRVFIGSRRPAQLREALGGTSRP